MTESLPTIGSVLDSLVPRDGWDDLPAWPPDVFAVTARLLNETEAFLHAVSPPAGRIWPPTPGWATLVREAGREWSARLGDPSAPPPVLLGDCWRRLGEARDVPLAEVTRGERWMLSVSILTLHALADEACADLGSPRRSLAGSFECRAWRRLRDTGSLSRLPTAQIRVVPKTHLTLGGINLRSLSRHLASYSSRVEVSWGKAPAGHPHGQAGRAPTYSVLLIPWPRVVRAADFRRTDGPLAEMAGSGFGFFQFDPQQPLDLAYVEAALQGALREAGRIDLLLLPEAAVLPAELEKLEELVAGYGVLSLTTGVREPARSETALGRNYAHLGLWSDGAWQRVQVDKHHRWSLDSDQIRQYHLSGVLPPGKRWWEAIHIPQRRLHLLDMEEVGPIAVLICEDLARLDAVAEVLRYVGPTLVLALLQDGPQLASRWSSRYAGVLADDPGSAVLTLTSLGMARRCRPAGTPASRVIALWKDPDRGQREIEIARGAQAVLLRLDKQHRVTWTADGRTHGEGAPRLVLEGVTQIYPPRSSVRSTEGAPSRVQAAIPRQMVPQPAA